VRWSSVVHDLGNANCLHVRLAIERLDHDVARTLVDEDLPSIRRKLSAGYSLVPRNYRRLRAVYLPDDQLAAHLTGNEAVVGAKPHLIPTRFGTLDRDSLDHPIIADAAYQHRAWRIPAQVAVVRPRVAEHKGLIDQKPARAGLSRSQVHQRQGADRFGAQARVVLDRQLHLIS